MEPAEYHVGDEGMGIWLVVDVKRCTSTGRTRLGKFDSLSDETAFYLNRVRVHYRAPF